MLGNGNTRALWRQANRYTLGSCRGQIDIVAPNTLVLDMLQSGCGIQNPGRDLCGGNQQKISVGNHIFGPFLCPEYAQRQIIRQTFPDNSFDIFGNGFEIYDLHRFSLDHLSHHQQPVLFVRCLVDPGIGIGPGLCRFRIARSGIIPNRP